MLVQLRVIILCAVAFWTGSNVASALSIANQQKLYRESLYDEKPGIYETVSSFIIIAEARCGKRDRSINKRAGFQARKNLMSQIARERQKRLRQSLEGLSALHSELLLRRYKQIDTAHFESLSLESGRRSPCRYREVAAIEKSALAISTSTSKASLQDLEEERNALFEEYLRLGKLDKLSIFYRQIGMPELSAVHGLNYLAEAGYPSFNFAAVYRDHAVASATTGEGVSGRKEAVIRIRQLAADCRALLFLVREAKGGNKLNLRLAAAPACSFENQVSDWGGRNLAARRKELAEWYRNVRQKDARGLVHASINSHGMLRFDGKASYGEQGAVMGDRDIAFTLFSQAENPKEILARLTKYLSQLPFDWKAWNKFGAVLRALNYPQSALSAHTQALSVGGINAETLAHLSKDHEAAGNIEIAKLYAQEVLRHFYPRSTDRWAIQTATSILAR